MKHLKRAGTTLSTLSTKSGSSVISAAAAKLNVAQRRRDELSALARARHDVIRKFDGQARRIHQTEIFPPELPGILLVVHQLCEVGRAHGLGAMRHTGR